MSIESHIRSIFMPIENELLICPQESYGKGPDYFLLKTAIFPISVFLSPFSMKFHTELEDDQHDSFNKGDSYLS